MIVRAEQSLPHVTVVTQNIDGLHARAGNKTIHELHGNLWRVRCDRCGVKVQDGVVLREQLRCPTCAGWWRPDIVWFEDYLDDTTVQAATAAIAGCDLFVSIGTSAVVYPAAALPQHAADNGALSVNQPRPDPRLALLLRAPARPGHRHARSPGRQRARLLA